MLVACFGQHTHTKDVFVAGRPRERSAASQTRVEDRRDLVHRLDFDPNSARWLGDRSDMRRRKERLGAKQALGLGESEIGARSADLERDEASDHALASRRVMQAHRARHFAPDPHVTAERRPLCAYDDRANGVAIARHRRGDRIGGGCLRDGLNSRDESEEMVR